MNSTKGPEGQQTGGGGSHGALRNFASGAKKLIKRHHGLTFAAVLAIAMSAIGLYVALNPSVSESSEEHELLEAVPQKVAWKCHNYQEGAQTELSFFSLASSRLECQPVDPGPESVDYFLFSNLGVQREYMHSFVAYLDRAGEPCERSYLEREDWVDGSGAVMGELLCRNVGGRSMLVWSESDGPVSDDVYRAGFARAPEGEESGLHHWWQRDVKFDGDGPPRTSLRHLRDLLAKDSLGHCIRDPEGLPGAIVTVQCSASGGISNSGGGLFPSQRGLEGYIDALAGTHPEFTREGCESSALGFRPYGATDGHSPLGKLFCYVGKGTEWFVWTANRFHLYAYAARDDEDWRRLFDEWENSFSRVSAGRL